MSPLRPVDKIPPEEPPRDGPPEWGVIAGNCMEVMAAMDRNTVDAVVTDPPYELGFMGKDWDRSDISFNPELWKLALRVLKPGGHLLAFGGSRTFHRIAAAIEDAGFEIRDVVMWLYGSGFPKSMDVSKAIDKAAGAEREVVGPSTRHAGQSYQWAGENRHPTHSEDKAAQTAPATDDAKKWEGWGTALKPAYEPIVVARKPLTEKTVAANVLEYGTGALNIDGTRIGTSKDVPASPSRTKGNVLMGSVDGTLRNETGQEDGHNPNVGRWPANVVMDEEAGEMLGDTSRFFYKAKTSKAERNAGLPEGEINKHPTVKPVELMRWLCRLVTPPGGIVLDPFTGSGSTGIAAVLEGFDFIGIELQPEYVDLAKRRIEHWAD